MRVTMMMVMGMLLALFGWALPFAAGFGSMIRGKRFIRGAGQGVELFWRQFGQLA